MDSPHDSHRPAGRFVPCALVCAALVASAAKARGEDWPQIHGPNRDGRSTEAPPPAPTGPPPVLWQREVGAGFAGPVVADGRLVLFHRVGSQEIVEALAVDDGRTLWRSSYPTSYRDDFGFDEGPRSPATLHDGRAFTFGAEGRLTAFDLERGRMLWQVDTAARFRAPKGFFGAADAPLVVGDSVLVNVGGEDAGIVSFDAATGEVRWRATDDGASYSSGVLLPRRAERNVPAAAFFTREGLALIDAANGSLLAAYPWRSRLRSSVNAALPVVVGDDVLLSASYGTGTVLLELGGAQPTPRWSSRDALACHYSTPVLVGDHLYAIHGRAEYGGDLRAVHARTGQVAWSEPIGAGSVLAVGDRLLILLDTGDLLVVAADPKAFRLLGRAPLTDSTTRAMPAYSDGVLYARDEDSLGAWRLAPAN